MSDAEIILTPVSAEDRDAFLAAVASSRELHHPWVDPPDTPDRFAAYLDQFDGVRNAGYLVRLRSDNAIAGVVNLNEIVRGAFCSAYLGYYAMTPHAGRGLMRAGLRLTVQEAFTKQGLHRVEANIQPGNTRSIALVRSLGFRREGYSPRYLRIDGEWRDHERWALTAEDFETLAAADS